VATESQARMAGAARMLENFAAAPSAGVWNHPGTAWHHGRAAAGCLLPSPHTLAGSSRSCIGHTAATTLAAP
jgi:hypothetical protein